MSLPKRLLALIKYALLVSIVSACTFAFADVPPFKIFQIGFYKCGTTTLANFFNANGIPSIHWGKDGELAYSMHINHFLKRPLLNQEYLDQYVGFFDMNNAHSGAPIYIGVMYFKELDRQYPGSKFILNVRNKEAWLKSQAMHKTRFKKTLLQKIAEDYHVSTIRMLEIWSELWDTHHAAVIEYFKDRPQDLLIFDIEKDPPSKITEFFAPYFHLDPELYGHDNVTKKASNKGLNFFDKIYCINLQRSPERKEHMLNEFKRLNITNYEFVLAVDADSPQVYQAMHSYKVKKYPPCFRCNKLICACKNNVLIAPQIGNWLSFVKVFEDMVQNNVQYALITEDDIKFTTDAEQIFNKIVNYENFVANKIDFNSPLLIRFFGRLDPDNRDLSNIHLEPTTYLSNPCFMVNKKFAELFLKQLHRFETTSDIFIHYELPRKYKNIQSFSVYPRPVYELSSGEEASGVAAQFYSTIHPKGIDAQDLQRKQQHVKRIEYWDYLRSKLAFWRAN